MNNKTPRPTTSGVTSLGTKNVCRHWLWVLLGFGIGLVGVGVLAIVPMMFLVDSDESACESSCPVEDSTVSSQPTKKACEDAWPKCNIPTSVDANSFSSKYHQTYLVDDLNIPLPEGWSFELVNRDNEPVRGDDEISYTGAYSVNIYNTPVKTEDHLVAQLNMRTSGLDGTGHGGTVYLERPSCTHRGPSLGTTPDTILVESAAHLSDSGRVIHEFEYDEHPNLARGYDFSAPTWTSEGKTSDLCVTMTVTSHGGEVAENELLSVAKQLPFWHEVRHQYPYVVDKFPVPPDEGETPVIIDKQDARVYSLDSSTGDLALEIDSLNNTFGVNGVWYVLAYADVEDDLLVFQAQPCTECDGLPTGFFSYDVGGGEIVKEDPEMSDEVSHFSPDGKYFASSKVHPTDSSNRGVGVSIYETHSLNAVDGYFPKEGQTLSPWGSGCPFGPCEVSVWWDEDDDHLLHYGVYSYDPDAEFPLWEENQATFLEEGSIQVQSSGFR